MTGFLLRSLPFLAISGLLFYLSSIPSPDPPTLGLIGEDKLLHVGAWIFLTLSSRPLAGYFGNRSRGTSIGRKAWTAAAIASLYGIFDEMHQSFVPGRTADPLDWLADCIGAAIGALLIIRIEPMVRQRSIIRRGDS